MLAVVVTAAAADNRPSSPHACSTMPPKSLRALSDRLAQKRPRKLCTYCTSSSSDGLSVSDDAEDHEKRFSEEAEIFFDELSCVAYAIIPAHRYDEPAMKLLTVLTALLATTGSSIALSGKVTFSYDYNPGLTTYSIACSDGVNGIRTKYGYKTLSQIPTYPYVGGIPRISYIQ